MTIALYGRQQNTSNIEFIEFLINALKAVGCDLLFFDNFLHFYNRHAAKKIDAPQFTSNDELKNKADFLFSIGGDGTILDTITMVQDSGMPVLGINTGRLGFLSSINKNEAASAIESLKKGLYSLDKRALLRLESNKNIFGKTFYALNELTIHKKDSATMMIVHTFLNGEYLNSYWADGLIIATPTGSTGYSMSCGGPIIMPQSENFVITPIAPHNLNVRPIIVSDKSVISVEVEGRSQYFQASLDSRTVTIDSSIQLAVRKEDFTLNLVRLDNENFLSTLRHKLNWGMDLRN
ncbi:MAG: NAD kinase [Bacteroidetes bacterium]|nr:NAD kinase [Bacteroidota bacterium]